MKIRLRWVLPAILVTLAGCVGGGSDHTANADPPAIAAPTQRVNAVSQAVGARMDSMLGTQHSPTASGAR
jgi:hypothetical protein